MKILSWINTNLLFLLSLLLLAFIPLFPKIPLADVIPGYIVKVRIEDLLIALTGLVWLREVRAKRIVWNTSYFWFVILYAVLGLISIFLGVFLLRTIPLEVLHIGKSGLHLFRYLEYFALFFFLFSAVKTKKQVIISLGVILVTLIGVVGYGFGQKYLHFPVYSTMNREYSKGEKLYLQEGARPQSTFAGHYDLAAYLVIVLPIIFSLAVSNFRFPLSPKKLVLGAVLLSAELAGVVMLILSGSKTSIAAYGVGILIVLFLYWLTIKSHKTRLILASFFLIISLVGGVVGWNIAPKELRTKVFRVISQLQSATELPSDLVGDGYEEKIVSTVLPDGSIEQKKVRVKSTWSPNALKYGLSMGIRLDTLWPQALLGLTRSLLTGSGYGTLAMLDTGLFQEADSTDNNYLRVLGETGLLGFSVFFGMVLMVLWDIYKMSKKNGEFLPLGIGFCAATIGLMLTAVYLDVFAASKVAFVFWAVAGLILKSGKISQGKEKAGEVMLNSIKSLVKRAKSMWPLLLTLLIAFSLLHQNPFMLHNPTKDINSYTAGVEEITAARCFVSTRDFSLCRTSGLVLKPHFSLYSVLLVPFLSTFKISGVYYYLNLVIFLGVMIASYRYIRRSGDGNVLLGLLAGLGYVYWAKLTSLPLDGRRLLLLLAGLPLVILFINWFLTRVKIVTITKPIRFLVIGFMVLMGFNSLWSGDLWNRFRQRVPNNAFIAIQEANGIIDSKPESPAYFATVINPYYADEYMIGKYSLLPLSHHQPYFADIDKVWGAPRSTELKQLYTQLLDSSAKLFISDYGIDENGQFLESFNGVKRDFDLSYVHLGCKETCNIYSAKKAAPLLSTNISTPFNGRVLRTQDFTPSYKFAVISNRYDSKVANTPRTTSKFIADLAELKEVPNQFEIFTGDVGEKPEGVFTKLFMDGYALQKEIPILYSAGNRDLIEEKDIDGGYKEFFTNTEYFILVDVQKDSVLSKEQQLKLYNSLLKLEKLPRIKSLFIISHDLNWQNQEIVGNAISTIERKLQIFPYIKKYILTSNHSSNLSELNNWFEMKENTENGITYIAGLTAGESKDVFTEISISEMGQVTIQGINLRR